MKAPADPHADGSAGVFFLLKRLQLTSNPAKRRSRRFTPALRICSDTRRAGIGALTVFAVAVVSSSCVPYAPEASGLRRVNDEIGRTILVKPEPQRIVSLAPSITETLFALGLGDRIVGVTTYCDYPAEAATKQKVGDTLRPSIERIVALKADLLIVSRASQLQQFVYNLDEVGIPVYVSDPSGVDATIESITRIGELTGAPVQARKLAASLRARVETVRARLSEAERPRVLCVLGSAPLITIGAGSFITDLINQAGGRSISEDLAGDYPQYSLETAVAKRPEVIFLQTGEADLPGRLKETPAGRSGRVFHIDDNLLLRPGPRIVDGLEQIARRLHPEVFGSE